jgi:hypothetical protein
MISSVLQLTLHCHAAEKRGQGDGWRAWGGGVLTDDPWPGQDFKEICGKCNDKGGMPPPPSHLSASVKHSMLEHA